MIDTDTPATAIMGGFMGAALTWLDHASQMKQSIAMDPADAIQVLARLRGEGKLDNLDPRDIIWLKKQSEVLLRECLKKWYRVISVHLTAGEEKTKMRLGGRVRDPLKVTSNDIWLNADPSRQVRLARDIAEQIGDLDSAFSSDPWVLFVQYDTSNAPGYPTNFDTKELSQFIKYLGGYFGNNKLPPIIWTPYSGESETMRWSNDHMAHEIILTSEASWDTIEKRTNWTIPVFQRDGVWCAGFGVDIFDFARSSGELRLKPWGWQSNAGTFDERIMQKFQSQSAEIITRGSQLLIPDKKIITPIWYTTWTKELTPYITHLKQDQFDNIRFTPRYAQIVAIPIEEIFKTVHAWEGSVDQYIHHNGREYRLAAGSLDMLLLFAQQNNIIKLQ